MNEENDEPIVFDALAAIHVARGDGYGQALETKFGLLGRRHIPMISIVTAGEMMRIARRITPRDEWERTPPDAVRDLIEKLYVTEITGGVQRAYAKIMARLDDGNSPLKTEFGWVAATAHVAGASVVTHHPDFGRLSGIVKCNIINRNKYFAVGK